VAGRDNGLIWSAIQVFASKIWQPMFRPSFERSTYRTRSHNNIKLGSPTIFYFNCVSKFETLHSCIITSSKFQLPWIKIVMRIIMISLEKNEWPTYTCTLETLFQSAAFVTAKNTNITKYKKNFK
jgi:hypothetical protein